MPSSIPYRQTVQRQCSRFLTNNLLHNCQRHTPAPGSTWSTLSRRQLLQHGILMHTPLHRYRTRNPVVHATSQTAYVMQKYASHCSKVIINILYTTHVKNHSSHLEGALQPLAVALQGQNGKLRTAQVSTQ